MSSSKKYTFIKITTALYIIIYMLLNATFVHTHYIDGESVTHAHPNTKKQHDANEVLLIKIINSSLGVKSSAITTQEFSEHICVVVNSFYKRIFTDFRFQLKPLRAPPANTVF